MSLKKFSAVMVAGTVAMAGTAMMTAAPALAVTPVSELRDVSPDHWAYNAIQTLVEKYQVMEGFPDRTFRGSKTLTRYELAAALAKVMAKVEQRIAQATGAPVEVEPGVNPEDLRTIARLQREFREELDALKSRVDTIDSRLMALEKRVRVGGATKVEYRDFSGASALAVQPWADFRVRNALMLDAQLMDDLSWTGQLNVDVYNPQSLANPYLRGTSAAPITDLYLPQSVLRYNPGWVDYSAGLGAFRNHMQLGSTLADPFKTNIWTNATGGYGFVGTPGWNVGGTSIGTIPTANGSVGAPAWLPGTNVIVDVVDPNNSQAFMPTGNLLSAANFGLGPVKLGIGFQRGALSSPYLMPGATTALPTTIPGFQTWGMGSMATATAGLDLGLARLNLLASSPALTATQTGVRDKTMAASLDLGSDAFGLTVEALGHSSFAFNDFAVDKGSVRVGSMNLFDTGLGLGLGLVAGNAYTMGLNTAGQPAFNNVAGTSLLGGTPNYHSWGVMLKTPSLFIIPSLTLAAQNTGSGFAVAGLNGQSLASGLSIQTDFNLFGLPTLTAEYSLGKFNPLVAGGADNVIWGSSPWSHEQLAIMTKVKW